jgi:hypothetical protein
MSFSPSSCERNNSFSDSLTATFYLRKENQKQQIQKQRD